MQCHSGQSLRRIADRRITLVAAIFCMAVGILPLMGALVLSFCSLDPKGSFHFGSMGGYRALIEGGRLDEYCKIVLRAAAVTLVTMFISVPTAYWIAKIKRAGTQIVIMTLLVGPWLVSDMLRAFGWQLLLSPIGPISTLWGFITHMGPLQGLRYNFGAVTVALISSMLPAGVLSTFAALPDRSESEWLAADELGQTRHSFALMALGRARVGILLGSCFVFILSIFSSAEARFLDGPTETSIQTVEASLVNDGVPALLAFGTILVATILFVSLMAVIVYVVLDKLARSRPSRNASRIAPISISLRSSRGYRLQHLMAGVLDTAARYGPSLLGLISITLCSLPLIAVAAEAFLQPSPSGMYWTTMNFRLMMSSDSLQEAITNSLVVASIVGCIAVIIGFVLSLTTWDTVSRRWVLLMLAALILLPGDSYAISLLQILRVFGVTEGGWVLLTLAHVLWALPFAAGTLLLANRQLDEHVLEAALEYGNGPMEVISRIIGRIQFWRIAGAALLAGTLSLNEYSRTLYLGAALLTVGNEVHGQLTSGLEPQDRGIFAAEFIISLISISTVLLVLVLIRSRDVARPERS
jgi:spermidine/putrescine transport system permease protein